MIWSPASAAAWNIVVDAEQMPPPMAPVWLLCAFVMTPPGFQPWAASIGPTAFSMLNVAPAPMTCPLSSLAGRAMFVPKPLDSSGK